MTKPPRVGICLGRSKAYLCLKFLGRSRPRLIHFLKIRPQYNWFILYTDLSSLSTFTKLSKSSVFAVFYSTKSVGIKIPTSHSFRVGWHATLIRVKTIDLETLLPMLNYR